MRRLDYLATYYANHHWQGARFSDWTDACDFAQRRSTYDSKAVDIELTRGKGRGLVMQYRDGVPTKEFEGHESQVVRHRRTRAAA